MEISFSGKRALVTGAGKGIGRCIAIELNKCGADVVALSRTQEDLDSLKAEHPSIEVVFCDLSSWDEARSIVTGLGDIDLLVNNAGVGTLEHCLVAKPEEFDMVMNINVKAAMNMVQVVAPGMEKRGGGAIVNISSNSSISAIPGLCSYSASKSALDSMTRVMALELGPKNIRVNAVNPTVIVTAMTKKFILSDPVKSKYHLDRIPLGRFGESIEVAQPVLFLLSDMASLINGVLLPIDGGYTAC